MVTDCQKGLTPTSELYVSILCGTESQHAEFAVAQLFPLEWSLWFVWRSFVDLSPFKSSPREAAERALAWPVSLPSWDNIFIPGWSGLVPLDSDHSASPHRMLWLTLMTWRGGGGRLGKRSFRHEEGRGPWHRVDMGQGR